jgi:transglutaminase-like putative cysteine protease
MRRVFLSLIAAVSLSFSTAHALDQFTRVDFLDESALPLCWSWMSSYAAGPDRLDEAAQVLGRRPARVDVVELYAGSVPLTLTAYHFDAAGDAERAFASRHDDGYRFAIHDRTVFEFECTNRYAIPRLKHAMGIFPRHERVWTVTMEVAPEYRGEDNHWNALYNALAGQHDQPDDQGAVFTAIDLAPRFRFDNKLLLPVPNTPWGTPEYAFEPQPQTREVENDQLTVTFGELPRTVDVPRVTVHATIPTRSFSSYPPDYKPDLYRLLLKTDPWPWTHGAVQGRLRKIVRGDWPMEEKIEEILCWVHFVLELEPGEPMGRNGILKTLETGQAYAWDRNDVFVSMCRFLDIPTRQVYGWLVGHGPHVWTRVYNPENNLWIDVEPTFGWMGVSEEYIPLFVSDIGHPPFVFTKTPEIEMVSDTIVDE